MDCFWPTGHIDAYDTVALLVDDGVDGERGLSGLAVADDELALAAADGGHSVDGFQTGLEGLLHRLPLDDTGGLDVDRAVFFSLDGALAVNGEADGVHHAAEYTLAHGDLHDPLGAPCLVAFLDAHALTEEHATDVVLFQVERHSHGAVGELDELTGHDVSQAIDTGDTITDRQDGTGLGDIDLLLVPLDLFFDNLAYLFRPDLHPISPLLDSVLIS